MQPRHAVYIVLAAVAVLYYAMGFHLAFLMDSPVFLIPATTLTDPAAPPWPYGRGLGYPLLLAPLLNAPLPGLAIVVVHLALICSAYVVLAVHLRSAGNRFFAEGRASAPTWLPWLPVGLAATALYSALHALAGSILSEILFATMAGFAVVAVSRVVLEPGETWRALLRRMAVAALPVAGATTVKPHWMIAGVVLSLGLALAGLFAARRIASQSGSAWTARGGIALVAAMPLAVTALVSGADRAVTAARAHPDTGLFGARSAFCNNAHLIHRVATASPELRLHSDRDADQRIRTFLAEVVPAGIGGWRVLGFDGDSCLFDGRLATLGRSLGDTPAGQASALLDAIRRAARHAPFVFARRVLAQIGYAIATPFDRYAVTLEHHEPAFAASGLAPVLGAGFFDGTRRGGGAGLLAWSEASRNGMPRKVVRVLLGAGFVALGALHLVLVVALPVLALVRWRRWSWPMRRAFLGLVAVPLAALFGHHCLVALVHSFDIWRYAFNTFFVSLALIGGAAIFMAGRLVPAEGASCAGHACDRGPPSR